MTKKKLNLNEQVHFPPFVDKQNNIYDLSHLDAKKIVYIQEATKDKAEKQYVFYVSYSMHCFAKKYDHLTAQDISDLMYKADIESRPFCQIRYSLSKNLPSIMNNLASSFIFHAKRNSYATTDIKNDDGGLTTYFVVFRIFRENKKFRIHVTSAYPVENSKEKYKKVNFFAIARKLHEGKPLPKAAL